MSTFEKKQGFEEGKQEIANIKRDLREEYLCLRNNFLKQKRLLIEMIETMEKVEAITERPYQGKSEALDELSSVNAELEALDNKVRELRS